LLAVDPDMKNYLFEGDSDEEIETMNCRRVPFDDGITFSKRGIVKYIDHMIDLYSDPDAFVVSFEKPDFKVSRNKTGSHLSTKFLAYKSEA
jgi:hypothetical protein